VARAVTARARRRKGSRWRARANRSAGMCSAWRAGGGRAGMPSTGCPMAARCRRPSARPGPAWTRRGRPSMGFFTKRSAEGWLSGTLDRARRGTLPGMVRTGATFADAAQEWLRYVEQERGRKASTLADYRSVVNAHLLPAFGDLALERIDTETIERWLAGMLEEGRLSRRSLQKMIVLLNGIFRRARRVWGPPVNPVADVERLTVPRRADIDFYSPEELQALVRAAGSEQDGAIYLTAGLTGLRMGELLALRWRDVDFAAQSLRVTASYTAGKLGTPKSGHGRVVPLVDEVAQALARLAGRDRSTASDDLVFAGHFGEHTTGRRCGAGSRSPAMRRACGRCASTTCAIRSAASRSAPPIRASCRSGWATRTSRRPRSICTTDRVPMQRADSRPRSRWTPLPTTPFRPSRRAPRECPRDDRRSRRPSRGADRGALAPHHPRTPRAHRLGPYGPRRGRKSRSRLVRPTGNERWYYARTDRPSAWLKVVVAYAGGRGHIVTAHARRSMP